MATNVSLLKKEIEKCPMSKTAIAAAWGMSMPTFYSRIQGKSEFTAAEIVTACHTLHLSKAHRDLIFFSK